MSEVIHMDPNDFDSMVADIENAPPPNAAMKELFRKHGGKKGTGAFAIVIGWLRDQGRDDIADSIVKCLLESGFLDVDEPRTKESDNGSGAAP